MFRSLWTQYFPPAPTFTEKHIPPQNGRVFIITGANSGIGFELAKSLYPTGCTLYLAGRNKESLSKAISDIQAITPAPSTPATLKSLFIDLGDLTTIKAAAEDFSKQESRLDILWNNAAIGGGKPGMHTAQNLEINVGTNCVGPLAFTQLLLPKLRDTAKTAPEGSVRVVWTTSAMQDSTSPKGGVDFESIESGAVKDAYKDYAVSKTGNLFLCQEAAGQWKKDGIVSTVINPGNLSTAAYRYLPGLLQKLIGLILYGAVYGAYTMMYAGFSEDVKTGDLIWPWGRRSKSERKDIYEAIENGAPTKFWKWCEEKYKPFL